MRVASGRKSPTSYGGLMPLQLVTEEDGQVTIYAASDHCSADCIGIHTGQTGAPLRGA